VEVIFDVSKGFNPLLRALPAVYNSLGRTSVGNTLSGGFNVTPQFWDVTES